MKRTGFKPRTKSLRDYCAEKRKREGIAKPKPKPPKAVLKRQSTARAREMRLYYQEAKEWLNRPEHHACAICLCLGVTPQASTEVHHQRGRIKKLLRDQRFWIPSCRSCRDIPHTRIIWARAMGLLSSATDWNTSPKD